MMQKSDMFLLLDGRWKANFSGWSETKNCSP